MVELENSSVWISIAVTIRSFDGLDFANPDQAGREHAKQGRTI